MTLVLDRCTSLRRGDAGYPASLCLLGGDAPERLTLCGSPASLDLPLVALFSSLRTPGDALVAAYDLARGLREQGAAVIGGFHTPLERECLDFLLRGRAPVVVAPPRGIEGMRVPVAWGAPLREGRLLVISPFNPERRRASTSVAEARNRVIAALAARVVIVHATPGGRVHRLAAQALAWGKPLACLDLPANHDLLVMGAEPIEALGTRH